MYRLFPASEEWVDIVEVIFNERQANSLDVFTRHLAAMGGPSICGVQKVAMEYAALFLPQLSPEQSAYLDHYAKGQLAVLVFSGMLDFDTCLPEALPPLAALEDDPRCLYLASRNQLLLCLVQQTPFAFDIDNQGKIIRIVGNFKGGGSTARRDEPSPEAIELSSHAGLQLGPHTEAPYHCCIEARDGHSPAPSSLVLTALWNPLSEPTHVIPLGRVLDRMGARAALALTSRSFEYTRSDCFVAGQGYQDRHVSILEFDEHGEFAARYNDYRFSVSPTASPWAKKAFAQFKACVNSTSPFAVVLQPSSAVLINNSRALHCRDIIRDNRRLLIRLFGYSSFAKPIVLNDDPLIVKG